MFAWLVGATEFLTSLPVQTNEAKEVFTRVFVGGMNVSVVLPPSALPTGESFNPSILVGQRSVCRNGSSNAHAVCTVFDAIPCLDLEVISEQVDCLEQILPCGVLFLGVMLSDTCGYSTIQLRSLLKENPRVNLLFAVIWGDSAVKKCELLQPGGRVELKVTTAEITFVSLPCYLVSPLDKLPLVLRARGRATTSSPIVDLRSSRLLADCDIWNLYKDIYAVQLGAKRDLDDELICVHVTFAPQHTCGLDIYRSIVSFIDKIGEQPQVRILRVCSLRNPALIYQWAYIHTTGDATGHTREQWRQVRELIEDGAGERLSSSRVLLEPHFTSTKMSVDKTSGEQQLLTGAGPGNVTDGDGRRNKGDYSLHVAVLVLISCAIGVLSWLLQTP
ncbi:hypothetical protein DPX39_030009500 [Trypanosoma brucei equiperdum]|nr:hypothetical protein DPX39_030009500 [Trypanosoma brucei equiperdum]